MIERSTLSDLLSYAYNETGLSESDRIQRMIDGDPLVRKEYDELTRLLQALDEARPEVPQRVMEKILQFC